MFEAFALYLLSRFVHNIYLGKLAMNVDSNIFHIGCLLWFAG